VLVLIAASKGTFKLAESRNAMNTIRRYAADDAHVIYGTAYDETLGDQLRVTVIATGLSSNRRAAATPPLLVVPHAPQHHQRTGTDNIPVLNQVAQPGPATTTMQAGQALAQPAPQQPERMAHQPHPRRGQGRCAGQQWHGRDRDSGISTQAGGLISSCGCRQAD
jgi:cell division protein FtsZ